MSEDKPTIVQFPQKEESNNKLVHILYSDSTEEMIDADAFAFTEEMPGYIAFWKENPYELLTFIASKDIKKLTLIDKNDQIDS